MDAAAHPGNVVDAGEGLDLSCSRPSNNHTHNAEATTEPSRLLKLSSNGNPGLTKFLQEIATPMPPMPQASRLQCRNFCSIELGKLLGTKKESLQSDLFELRQIPWSTSLASTLPDNRAQHCAVDLHSEIQRRARSHVLEVVQLAAQLRVNYPSSCHSLRLFRLGITPRAPRSVLPYRR